MKRSNRDVQQLYREVIGRLDDVFLAVGEGRSFDVAGMSPLVRRMVAFLRRGNALLQLIIQRRHMPSSLAVHSTHVAITALKLGIRLGYEREGLTALGMTALFHDVGMGLVPRSILEKRGSLSKREWQLVYRHPQHGAALLEQMVGPELSWLPGIVKQEHERMDGSGYPLGLQGNEVHEMAYIIGLTDGFEAMTHNRAYRAGFTSLQALEELSQQRDKAFPVQIMGALVDTIMVDFSL